MKEGLAIAGATYRLLVRIVLPAVAVLALPYAASIAIVYTAQSIGGSFRWPLDLLHGFSRMAYIAALLRAVLLHAPLSPRTLSVGRVELHMLGVGVVLILLLMLLHYVHVTLLIALFGSLILALGDTVSWFVFMGGYLLVFLYIASRLVAALPLIVVRGMNFADALTQSWVMTRGHVGAIFIAVLLVIVPIGEVATFGVYQFFNQFFPQSALLRVISQITEEYINATTIAVLVAVSFQSLAPPAESR